MTKGQRTIVALPRRGANPMSEEQDRVLGLGPGPGGGTYVSEIPADESEIPAGQVLVHNNIKPASPLGMHGFRAWTQVPDYHVTECGCGWAPDLPQHYRVIPPSPVGV